MYHSTQLNFQGGASLARRYSIRSHYSTFELGLKIRNAHKTQNENDHFFDANPGTNFTLAQTVGGYTNPNYYDGSFTVGPMTDYNRIRQVIAANLTTGFTENADKNRIVSDPATWDTSERVYAGYAMNTIAFGKVRLQTGVRIEATDSSYTANQVTLNNGAYVSTTPVAGSGGYINVLPSVQVQYMLGKDTNIRTTYGMGISRPNFSDLVPSVQVDPNTSPKSLQIGNPALKPTKANNFDVLV
jgi:outer membrane receptor protein involved in Fe transport